MTIEVFIKNPEPFNRALTIKLIRHIQRNFNRFTQGENLVIGVEGEDFYGEDLRGWVEKEWEEMVNSMKNASQETLEKAADLMISGWQRSVICSLIDKN